MEIYVLGVLSIRKKLSGLRVQKFPMQMEEHFPQYPEKRTTMFPIILCSILEFSKFQSFGWVVWVLENLTVLTNILTNFPRITL